MREVSTAISRACRDFSTMILDQLRLTTGTTTLERKAKEPKASLDTFIRWP